MPSVESLWLFIHLGQNDSPERARVVRLNQPADHGNIAAERGRSVVDSNT